MLMKRDKSIAILFLLRMFSSNMKKLCANNKEVTIFCLFCLME